MQVRVALGLLLAVIAAVGSAASAQNANPGAKPAANVGAELSPGVAWEPHGPLTRAVGLRRLNPAEVRLAQQRAAGFYAAFKASPSFSTPRDRAHLVTSSAAIEPPWESNRAKAPILQHSVTAYWTVPRDVRRQPDGVLTPVLGGAHDLVYFETNFVPRADQLVDRETAGDFTRGVSDGRHGGYFAQPRVLGQLGGGTVYADVIVLTRDGSSVLVPAPIGALLDIEIERLSKVVVETERGSAERIKEAEAGMAPDKVAERRAKREQVWQRETRDPAQLAQRLDAAHRSDLSDLERTRRDFSIPAQPDPRHRFWGPKLALDAAQKLNAALGATGRNQPACGRTEPGFASYHAVRFEVAGSVPNCVPMVQVRADLLDPKRPLEDVQLLIVMFRGSKCGEVIGGARPLPTAGRCGYGVPLLREMDWAVARKALGWP
jgi:hypothetical protein